ncbi:hypothetical protein BYT27DRAFT_7221489 [Phlegmacium glaucopus]|nr:hypothetical protein BYT27DRAFT_7221489 [Phlegmacium glaucopus]
MITHDDFANYQHQDSDAVAVAYGLWWAACLDMSKNCHVLSDTCDHDQVSGGSFLIGNYGIGVDFQKCHGLVEIAWRGTDDYHSTMLSHSQPQTTCFGTLVQITASAATSMRSWIEGGLKRSQVVTYYD